MNAQLLLDECIIRFISWRLLYCNPSSIVHSAYHCTPWVQ